jgi:8-oxo-dGTP diphosphatase
VALSPYIAKLRAHVGHDLLLLPGVSAVVFNDAGEILLNHRSDTRTWSLIAGVMDPGEQPADTIVREIREETGIEAAIEHLVGVAMHPVTYPNGDSCEYLSIWFRARAVSGEATVNDDESTAVQWFPLDALPDLDPWVRLRIDKALENKEAAWYPTPGVHYAALES